MCWQCERYRGAEGKRETWRKKEEINRMKIKRGGQKRKEEVEKSELKLE